MIHVTATPIHTTGIIHLDLSSSGEPPADPFVLYRREVGGTELSTVIVPTAWTNIDGEVVLITWQAAFDDTTAPLDVAVEYLAAPLGSTPTVVSNPATLNSPGGWWLGDPMRPHLNQVLSLTGAASAPCSGSRAIFLLSLGPEERTANSSLTKVVGRGDMHHSSQPMRFLSSDFILATRQLSDLDAVNALLDPGGVLLLREPGTGTYGIGNRFCSVGRARESRLSADARRTWRQVEVEYDMVLQPAGGSFGGVGTTWSSLCDGPYADLAAMTAAGVSWRTISEGHVGGSFPSTYRLWSEVSATWATWADLTATGKTWKQIVEGA